MADYSKFTAFSNPAQSAFWKAVAPQVEQQQAAVAAAQDNAIENIANYEWKPPTNKASTQTPADLFVSAAVPKFQTVEETRAALQGYDDRYSGYATDPLSSQLYQNDTQMFRDREQEIITENKAATPEQPEKKQSGVDRFLNFISGLGKSNAAAATGGQRLLYEAGQGARSQVNEELYAQAKADVERAQRAYDETVAEFGEEAAQMEKNLLEEAQRRLSAFGTVVEDEVQQKATRAASELSQELDRQSQEDYEKAKEGLGTLGRVAVDAGAALGDVLIDASANLIAPGMGVASVAGRAFGKGAIEAEAEGATVGQQLAYSTTTAGFATGLNKVFDGLAGVYGKGFGDDAAEAFIAKIASTDKGRNIARAVLNIGGEGIEEFTEGAANPLLKLIYDGGAALKNVYSSPEAWADALVENLYGAAIGSLIGAGGQAVDIASGGYARANAALPTQATPQNEPQSAPDNAGGTQIPANPETAPVNPPDVLNTAEQPKSGIDMVVEAATGNKNAAPSQGTDSTAVNTNPAQHTPAEQAVIDEYQNAVDDNLVVAVEAVANNPDKPFSRHNISDVSQRQADEVSAKLGGDYTGYKNAINTNGIKHILNRHGVNGEQDNSMADVNDIARVGYVLNNFDAIDIATDKKGNQRFSLEFRTSDDKPAPMVVFSKKVNGTYYVVEAVPDTKYKKMWVVSAYMDKKGGFTQAPDANSPENTPNASLASQPQYEAEASNPYIAQSGSNVNAGSESGQGPERARGYEQNVASSEVTDPELKARVEESLQTYRQLGNVDTLKKAQDIMLRGLPEAQAELQQALGKAKDGAKLTPEMVPLSRLVANELTRNGDVATARQIIADVAVELTAAGQLGQAARIMRTADPATALDSIRKALEKINAEVKQKNPTAKWTAELTAEEEQLIAETDFTQDGAFEQVYDQIARRIGGEMPASWWEKLTELRRINMLLRPRSIIKNTVGNVPMKYLRKGAENLSAAIQKALPQDQRTRGFASAEQKGLAREYYAENKDDILRQGDRWDINSLVREYKTVFKGGAVEKVLSKVSGKEVPSILEAGRKLTYNMLEGGDAPFVRSAFVDSLAQYMAAQGINSADAITQEAIDFAMANAMEATFKNANVVSTALNNIKRNADPAVAAALDVLFPFTTTPTNILTQTIKYSPVGLGGGLLNALTRGANASNIDAISKGTVGTAVMLLGWALRNMGAITGAEDEDKDKAALDKATGNNIYSIGGKVSYDWAQPVGSLLALGAEISDAVSEQESWASAFANALYTAGDSVLNMSIFQNVLSVLKGTGATKNLFDTIIEGGATQLIPGLAGDIAKIIDGTVRSTYTGGNVFDDAAAKMQANIPFASKNLPASVNVKGEANTRGGLGERALNTLLNPATVAQGERTAADDEVYRIFEETGSKTHFPSVSPYSVEFDGETFKMTGEERAKFQTTQGQAYQDIVGELIDNAVYKKASLEQKREVLDDVREYSLKLAKDEFLAGKGEEYDWQSKSQETASKLDDPATYLAEMAIAKSKAESRGETFSTDGRDSFAYFTERGINAKDLDIISGSMLGERQQEVYNTFRGADFAPDVVMSMYKQMDGEKQDGRYNQADVYAILSSISDDVMSAEQKAIVWANTQTGSTDWATYLAKNAR